MPRHKQQLPHAPAHHVDLVLLGFGHVARRVVGLLEEQSERLARDHGLTWRLVGIATRSHGLACNPAGIDARTAVTLAEGRSTLSALGTEDPPGGYSRPAPFSTLELIDDLARRRRESGAPGRLVVVEATVLTIEDGEPAVAHVRAAIDAGADVISVNKGPVAFAYRTLRQRAEAAGVRFLFEGTVMDGVPVFNLVREALPALEIVGFRGVVNSTTNYILTALEDGRAFDVALAEMQAAGVAEADPAFDLDGWDAAAKTAALVNVLMDGAMTPHDVERAGIRSVTSAGVRDAVARGRRTRLVASAERRDQGIVARVRPTEVADTDLLATLRGMQNALVIQTDLVGEIVVVQLDPGLTSTAYAVVSDLVRIVTDQD